MQSCASGDPGDKRLLLSTRAFYQRGREARFAFEALHVLLASCSESSESYGVRGTQGSHS